MDSSRDPQLSPLAPSRNIQTPSAWAYAQQDMYPAVDSLADMHRTSALSAGRCRALREDRFLLDRVPEHPADALCHGR